MTSAARTRIAAAAGLVLAVALAAVVLLGGGQDERSSLAWQGKPLLMQSGKPTDRVFQAQLRNDSLRDVKLTADDIRALDSEGHAVRTAARFLPTFAHGLYAWSQMPDQVGDFERKRLGQIATIKPGQSIPLTISWRVPQGGEQPVRLDFGDVSLRLPPAVPRSDVR